MADPPNDLEQLRRELAYYRRQVEELTVNLVATSNLFAVGHRVRVDVTSASFPRFDRNPNTGAPLGADANFRPARQTVLHNAAHPSHIVLPVIPG